MERGSWIQGWLGGCTHSWPFIWPHTRPGGGGYTAVPPCLAVCHYSLPLERGIQCAGRDVALACGLPPSGRPHPGFSQYPGLGSGVAMGADSLGYISREDTVATPFLDDLITINASAGPHHCGVMRPYLRQDCGGKGPIWRDFPHQRDRVVQGGTGRVQAFGRLLSTLAGPCNWL